MKFHLVIIYVLLSLLNCELHQRDRHSYLSKNTLKNEHRGTALLTNPRSIPDVDFLITQTLIPTMQNKSPHCCSGHTDTHVQINYTQRPNQCLSLIIAVRKLPHEDVTLIVTDERKQNKEGH